jgi:hypothetical protein
MIPPGILSTKRMLPEYQDQEEMNPKRSRVEMTMMMGITPPTLSTFKKPS